VTIGGEHGLLVTKAPRRPCSPPIVTQVLAAEATEELAQSRCVRGSVTPLGTLSDKVVYSL